MSPGIAVELTERERTRLASILARLASPFEGERAAAGLLASAFVERHGLDWSALVTFLGPRPQPAPDAIPGRQERRRNFSRGWRGYERRRRVLPGQAVNLSL